MISADVIEIYRELEKLGITVWIDGGSGVDALLGEQTRPHKDLDIAIQQLDVPRLRSPLRTKGYQDIKPHEARRWNFVLGDEIGREIDVHVIVLDSNGDGIYGSAENGQRYPAASLTGTGNIQGRVVKCISAVWAVKFHSGYPLQEKDFADVSTLCRKFGLQLPEEYLRFAGRELGTLVAGGQYIAVFATCRISLGREVGNPVNLRAASERAREFFGIAGGRLTGVANAH